MNDRKLHDIEAEQAVLGSFLQSSTAIEDALTAGLQPDHYFRTIHGEIHRVIIDMRTRGIPVDALTVADELQRRKLLNKLGGKNKLYLYELMEAVPSSANAGYYARTVVDWASRRKLIEIGNRAVQLGGAPDLDLTEARDRLVQELSQVGGCISDSLSVRRLVLTSAADIEPRPVRWGWESRLPVGHVSLIPGREGIGKSLLLTWMIAQITRGELPGAYFGEPRPVFYCATEDSWQHTVVPRLIAAGADRDLVYRVEVESIETSMRIELTLPRDCDLLGAEIKRTDAAMVALDPMMSAIDHGVDTYNDRDMRTVLEPLGAMAEDTGCMVVALAHFNKSAGDDPLNLVTGSRAFTAFVRSVIAVARDPDSEDGSCVVSQVKNNLGRLDLPNLTYIIQAATVETHEGDAQVGRLHFTGESERGVREILAEAANGAERTERAECADWLRETLAAGPQRTKDVEAEGKERGFSQRTQWRARKQLGIRADQLATGPKGRNEWWLSMPETGCHEPS
jgi:hypothetical protein